MKKVILLIASLLVFSLFSIVVTAAVEFPEVCRTPTGSTVPCPFPTSVLVYNSAKSNVSNKIHDDVLNDVDNLLKEVKQAEPREDAKKGLNAVNVKLAKEIHEDVLSNVIQLKGSWDEVEDVPCDLRGELGLEECEEASSQREATLGTFQKGTN